MTTVIPLLAAMLFTSGNSAEDAQLAAERDYLRKINVGCGLSLTIKYDGESLRKNNKDIGWDQTGGSNECNEPLRYIWYACQSERGKEAVKRTKISALVCKGTSGQTGSLTLKSGTVTVERAFEESKPFVRAKKQFEAIIDFALKIESEDPYYDDKWSALRQQENPVTSTETFCLVNGKKVEFRTSLEDPFERRHEDGTVKCTKDGQPFCDLVITKGKKTGFSTNQRDGVWARQQYKDGKRHGEQRTTDGGRVTEIARYSDGEEVTRTEFYKNGKLAKHSHRFPGHWDEISLAEDGKFRHITCSPQSKDDEELRKWCGFNGSITNTIYDGTGKVSRVQTYLDGVLQKESAGDSDYGSGSEVAYQDGRKHGEERVVDKKGVLKSTIHWDHGNKDGKETQFAEGGKKVAQETVWSAGEMKQSTEFFLNGNPKLREIYDAAKKRRVTRFWDTGKVQAEGTQIECERRHYRSHDWCEEGVQKTYYENGTPESEANYSAGVQSGEYKAWWDNGKLSEVSQYAEGKHTARKTWDRDGKLLLDEEYEADGSRNVKR